MKISEPLKISQIYKITKAKLEIKEHFELNDEIVRRRKRGLPFQGLLEKLNSICKTEVVVVKNLLLTVGRAAIAEHLTSNSPSPSSLEVNKVALGTGTTAPANGDTTLETETYRNNTASATNSDNIAYITGFFGADETSGTFKEVGLFINGGSGADTGTLLSRAAINITKSTTETLTIDYTITIS